MHRGTSPASLARGSLWMLVAGLLFSAMGVLVKLGAREFSAAELVFYRSLFGFVAILPAIIRQRGFMTPYWRWHLSRSLLGTAGISLHFFAIFWGEWLDPGEWLGLGLIVASGVMATSGLNRPTTAARAAIARKDESRA